MPMLTRNFARVAAGITARSPGLTGVAPVHFQKRFGGSTVNVTPYPKTRVISNIPSNAEAMDDVMDSLEFALPFAKLVPRQVDNRDELEIEGSSVISFDRSKSELYFHWKYGVNHWINDRVNRILNDYEFKWNNPDFQVPF